MHTKNLEHLSNVGEVTQLKRKYDESNLTSESKRATMPSQHEKFTESES